MLQHAVVLEVNEEARGVGPEAVSEDLCTTSRIERSKSQNQIMISNLQMPNSTKKISSRKRLRLDHQLARLLRLECLALTRWMVSSCRQTAKTGRTVSLVLLHPRKRTTNPRRSSTTYPARAKIEKKATQDCRQDGEAQSTRRISRPLDKEVLTVAGIEAEAVVVSEEDQEDMVGPGLTAAEVVLVEIVVSEDGPGATVKSHNRSEKRSGRSVWDGLVYLLAFIQWAWTVRTTKSGLIKTAESPTSLAFSCFEPVFPSQHGGFLLVRCSFHRDGQT